MYQSFPRHDSGSRLKDGGQELTVQNLAGGAMAVLCVQWLLSAQLILDPAAVAASLITDFEFFAVLMDFVGRAVLPIVETHSGG